MKVSVNYIKSALYYSTIIIRMSCISCVKMYNTSDIVNIIKIFHQIYYQDCVAVILNENAKFSGFQDLSVILNVTKQLNHMFIKTTYITYTRLLNVEIDLIVPDKSILVLPFKNDEAKYILENIYFTAGLASQIWLLFLITEISLEEYFIDIIIPFNCLFIVVQSVTEGYIFREVFKVSQNSSIKPLIFGTWSLIHGLNVTKLSMYERRNKLDGTVIAATTIEDSPFTKLINDSGQTILKMGYLGQVWKILQNEINFTSTWIEAPDNIWGTFENNTWNGMIEMVRSKEVEVAVAAFSINSQRLKVVHYTIPVFTSNRQIFIKVPEGIMKISWSNFLRPFSDETWFTLAGVIMLLGIHLSVFYWIGTRSGFEDAEYQYQYAFPVVIFTVLGAFCQQGCSVLPRSAACRIVLLACYLTAVVIIASFSAALVSFLAKHNLRFPFDSFQGLIDDGSYKLTLLRKSAELDFFKDTNDSVLTNVYEKLIQPNENELPNSQTEAVRQVCQRDKYAIFSTATHLSVTRNEKNCRLVALPISSYRVWFAIIWNKDSWYKDIINFYLRKLKDSGSLKKIILDEVPQMETISATSWNSISFNHIVPVIILLSFGFLFAILIFVVERYTMWRHRYTIYRQETSFKKNDSSEEKYLRT